MLYGSRQQTEKKKAPMRGGNGQCFLPSRSTTARMIPAVSKARRQPAGAAHAHTSFFSGRARTVSTSAQVSLIRSSRDSVSRAAKRLHWAVRICSNRLRTPRALPNDTGAVFFFGDQEADGFSGVLVQFIAAFFALQFKNADQFLHGIIVKMQIPVETGFQAGIGMDKGFHQPVVAGDNDDQVVPVILHGFEQGVDGFLAEIVFAFCH